MTFNLQSDRNEKGSRAENAYLQAGGAIMDDDPGGDGAEMGLESIGLDVKESQKNEVIMLAYYIKRFVEMPNEEFETLSRCFDTYNASELQDFIKAIRIKRGD